MERGERETNKKKGQLCAHLDNELKEEEGGQLLYSALLKRGEGERRREKGEIG